MARQKIAPEVLAHLEWLGFVQPTGLVVSGPALVKAGAILDRRDAQGQVLLKECVAERTVASEGLPQPYLPDFEHFARTVLGWSFSSKFYAGTADTPVSHELELVLPEFGETIRPDYAVREPEPKKGGTQWQLLVRVLEAGADFDRPHGGGGRFEASEHSRMERLLRHTGVLAGLLFNGTTLRLISAPRGESSGWLDFRVADMLTTAGRPISTAMRLLLSERRLLALPKAERLTALLEDSRKYQNEVSERLAEQVLHALYELLRGFQAAHDAAKGELLREPLAEHPDEVYHALLTVLLRLVFLLYAEERGMLPDDEAFVRYYSIAGLHERLREDGALFPDTMDQRFGAWAQLVALFRMVHDGAKAPGMHLPERHGALFDPDRFPFLEGRGRAGARQIHERIEVPLVPDGTIYRALEKLLVLDGERISYRALDVEQIGSVYETMMGFRLETAHGSSLAIRPQKRLGAPVTIDLAELLSVKPDKREKWFIDATDRRPSPSVKAALKDASALEGLHAALEPLIDRDATPDIVPPVAMVLQPSEERRRSGSHYTPRSLTEPIVRTTLEPILERLKGPEGAPPRPEQILGLKVCDPAMGSGAFLVETCRQLADALIESWDYHDAKPEMPADEDEVVFARRQIAQRCLYGVDRNPVAVDLAKMSLWLVTLAREHPLTFVDHALKHGDSLVGLSPEQIEGFHWDEKELKKGRTRLGLALGEHLDRARELRDSIRTAADGTPEPALKGLLREVDEELDRVKLAGDLVLAAFFSGAKPAERQTRLAAFVDAFERGGAGEYRSWLEELRHGERPLVPFHWQLEFPEVFERESPGFDGIVGNPPFLGGTQISEQGGMLYFQWLTQSFPGCRHHCDLVAYFFRRAYVLLCDNGTLGLVATNTVSEGDTREGGLKAILEQGGEVFSAVRRLKWPGVAAVTVSVVHVAKGPTRRLPRLDGVEVPRISAYLVAGNADTSPARLRSNPYFSLGSKIYGQGFLFADDGEGTPISERARILAAHPDWYDRVPYYLGGEEINSDPMHLPRRYVIQLSDVADESSLDNWPELAAIVEAKVRPERMLLGANPNNVPLKRRWWAYQAHRPELYRRISQRAQALCCSGVSQHLAFVFSPSQYVFSHAVVVFDIDEYSGFGVLQSRVHEVWARFFASSLEDRLRYTASDCFETFVLPDKWRVLPELEAMSKAYYEFRADLMVRNDEGLTKTYNRFHDPDEDSPDILKLRQLHEAMDRAVLAAYGWTDIPTACAFILDYEVEGEDTGRRKKPWRYRWPDDVRDEVLARLLELNAERAAEEALAGGGATKSRAAKPAKPAGPESERLF